jgi:hypothetical protein
MLLKQIGAAPIFQIWGLAQMHYTGAVREELFVVPPSGA